MNVKEEKAALRRECARIRNGLAAEEKAMMDERICRNLLSLAVFRFAKKLLLYHPIRSEVDVLPLMQAALAAGKEVYFPLCDPEKAGVMTFHRVTSRQELTSGSFSVPEPSAAAPLYENDSSLAVCVIPALAFDKEGYRLGYGKGYYDRFLADFTGTRIGVGYSTLVLPQIPHNRFDLKTDLIVTEKGVRITSEI